MFAGRGSASSPKEGAMVEAFNGCKRIELLRFCRVRCRRG
jgi:hypothetical protein